MLNVLGNLDMIASNKWLYKVKPGNFIPYTLTSHKVKMTISCELGGISKETTLPTLLHFSVIFMSLSVVSLSVTVMRLSSQSTPSTFT